MGNKTRNLFKLVTQCLLEQRAEINALKGEIKALKNEIETLKFEDSYLKKSNDINQDAIMNIYDNLIKMSNDIAELKKENIKNGKRK